MPAWGMSTVPSGPAPHSGKRNPKRDPAAGGNAHLCMDRTSVGFAAAPGEAETREAAVGPCAFFPGLRQGVDRFGVCCSSSSQISPSLPCYSHTFPAIPQQVGTRLEAVTWAAAGAGLSCPIDAGAPLCGGDPRSSQEHVKGWEHAAWPTGWSLPSLLADGLK